MRKRDDARNIAQICHNTATLMSDIVNLRQFKKKKARDTKEKQAEQNRILFGRTKVEKDFARAQVQKAERFLDMNRRETKDLPEGEK
nr:DUF4169 family protein [Brucella sp. 458]